MKIGIDSYCYHRFFGECIATAAKAGQGRSPWSGFSSAHTS